MAPSEVRTGTSRGRCSRWCDAVSPVSFRSINDAPVRTAKTTFRDILFDVGLRGQLGELGDYFKTWNWELGFRYSRNEEENLIGGVVSGPGVNSSGSPVSEAAILSVGIGK